MTHASLADYQAHPERYVQRVHPERENWGPYMDTAQLIQAGLSDNRVAVPGDWDYTGEKVDGVWNAGELSAKMDVRA